ncbi:DNA-binding protein [Burkholderia sp. SG-MS1]|uniref:DNA-binding protein n=1 Tax=Paraburkholderia sp. SG-MS1 TaxID=2023741 RepID=UPI0014452BC5|nr:DNA-binding protein [Paraburkholderia sp. SG-MS1]NKJ45852.1 DNA-binding protein [Paraburkholderia sp. SG-MS1]
MTSNQLAAIAKNRPLLSTDELATLLTLRPQSIRKRLCQTGAYFCLRPVKMPNGRLMWPADSIEQLSGGL